MDMYMHIWARKILHYMAQCACMHAHVCSGSNVYKDLCTHVCTCMWAKARGQAPVLLFSLLSTFLFRVSHWPGSSQVR